MSGIWRVIYLSVDEDGHLVVARLYSARKTNRLSVASGAANENKEQPQIQNVLLPPTFPLTPSYVDSTFVSRHDTLREPMYPTIMTP